MVKPVADWSDRSHELSRLLARAGLGDRAAFATLYERTSSHLFAVVLRINRDRAQAEDILQEVYVNVWRAASGFDAAQSQPLTWLTSIARNRAIDSLRASQHSPRSSRFRRRDEEGRVTCTTMWPQSPGTARSAEPGLGCARAGGVHGGPERATAPERGPRLLRWPEPCRGGRADAPAAGHGQELGAPGAVVAQGLPGVRGAARQKAAEP